jgi:DNA repair protein RecN (Recombination protein N)
VLAPGLREAFLPAFAISPDMGIGNSDSSSDTYTMLNHLHINDFAIVPTLDLEIGAGFTAITGETGAGKSILVDALGLLLGDRSDANWVRAGAARAELTAEFDVTDNKDAQQWLAEFDLSTDDACLLRRTINANGRSRAFINGTPVTLAQIQSLGHLLVEIHGQNEHLRLTRPAEQFKLLDRSGNHSTQIKAVEFAHAEWKRLNDELNTLDQETAISATDLEFLNFQLDELQQHDLGAGSITALQTEHDRLTAGDSLLDALTASIELLEPESAASDSGINSGISTCLGQLQEFIPLDEDINAASQMLREAAVNCEEAINSLRSARERVDLNPARYTKVANTLGQLHELSRKHRVRMEELDAVMQKLSARIARASGSEQRRSELKAAIQTCLASYRQAAGSLHQKRKQQADRLSQRVMDLMSELGMAGGIFALEVFLNPESPPSSRGDDEVEIKISANPGTPPGPLGKIASGGELSRISLAIKVAAASANEAVTQIFDEVDAGIGGDTANAVGGLLKRLAGSGQALCVTHLAQVAVCATHQLQVSKASGEVSTIVDTSLLGSDDRVDEIARMLSGKISEQSRAHAAELLNAANNTA